LSIEEKHRCSKKLLSDGAVWTAYRPAPARVLETLFYFYLASMSQLRSSVLMTPLRATAPRLDLNTYQLFGMSSKQHRELGREREQIKVCTWGDEAVTSTTRHTERSKSVFNVHNVHDVHNRRGCGACLVNVVNIVNIENKLTPSATGGASVPTDTLEEPPSA